jgi:hypothetical protein
MTDGQSFIAFTILCWICTVFSTTEIQYTKIIVNIFEPISGLWPQYTYIVHISFHIWNKYSTQGWKNRRAREHCSQEMLNSCRKFVSMKICYWKFEGNLNTHVPLWAQQHIVDRHYSLNLKPWSARTLYVYAHADLAQKYSVALQEICVSSLLPGWKLFFPALTVHYIR